MNRIDRLTAILLLLQTGKRSAAEIAQHFEVSRRTIQRDIDALCEMGIPIAADLGATGLLLATACPDLARSLFIAPGREQSLPTQYDSLQAGARIATRQNPDAPASTRERAS